MGEFPAQSLPDDWQEQPVHTQYCVLSPGVRRPLPYVSFLYICFFTHSSYDMNGKQPLFKALVTQIIVVNTKAGILKSRSAGNVCNWCNHER